MTQADNSIIFDSYADFVARFPNGVMTAPCDCGYAVITATMIQYREHAPTCSIYGPIVAVPAKAEGKTDG